MRVKVAVEVHDKVVRRIGERRCDLDGRTFRGGGRANAEHSERRGMDIMAPGK